MNSWLAKEITEGVTKLYALCLDGTPSATMIQGTAMAWIETIESKGQWFEHADADRFKSAFSVLMRTCTRWPAPAMFIQALPSRAETDALLIAARPRLSPEQQQENLNRLAGLVEQLCGKMDAKP